MTILDVFLKQNCTAEQSTLLLYCFETLSKLGLVEIEFNIDELLAQIENLDLFEIVQCCYQYIRKCQNMAFNSLQLNVDNTEDIRTPMYILYYLDQIEDSAQHELICEIIDDASNPEEALFSLLERVAYADLTDIHVVMQAVSVALIERIYSVHKTQMDAISTNRPPIPEIDERKLSLLKELWAKPEINLLRQDILDKELNLPVSKKYWSDIQLESVKALQQSKEHKLIALKLLEYCLVTDVEWRFIKDAMRALAKEIFNDLLFTSELTYALDNVCMEHKINGVL